MDIYEAANRMKSERKTIFDLNIRVTFYARVSSLKDEQENSIEHQIEYFTDFIRNNPNWTYVNGYIDRIRGESAENRVQFLRMIDDGKDGMFDLVITKEVSRFARNTVDSLQYTRELLRAGVGVFFQNDNICTIDTDSELRLTIMASIAQDEVRKMSECVRWGHKRSIESGVVEGNGNIFGYDKDHGKLIINEPEAEMVRFIFENYATGECSVRKIEKMLNEKGYRGRKGTPIQHNTISGIIQNPKYKGYYCGNKVKIVDYRTKEQKFLSQDEWIMYKDETGKVVPQIVSEEIWDRCNEIFKQRSMVVKDKSTSYKRTSPFSGLLRCTHCNALYWRTSHSNSSSKGKSIYQFLCSNKHKINAKVCPSFSVMENDLYLILSDVFKSLSDNIDEYVKDFINIYTSVISENDYQNEISALTANLNREKSKCEKLLDLYTDNIITKSDFAERNATLKQSIMTIENKIRELTKIQQQSNDDIKNIKNIEKYIKEMYDESQPMTHQQVEVLATSLIHTINIEPIDKNTMKLHIVLKSNVFADVDYSKRNRNLSSSGNMVKKMNPKREMNMTFNVVI